MPLLDQEDTTDTTTALLWTWFETQNAKSTRVQNAETKELENPTSHEKYLNTQPHKHETKSNKLSHIPEMTAIRLTNGCKTEHGGHISGKNWTARPFRKWKDQLNLSALNPLYYAINVMETHNKAGTQTDWLPLPFWHDKSDVKYPNLIPSILTSTAKRPNLNK